MYVWAFQMQFATRSGSPQDDSASATFGRQFKQRIAGQPRTVVLANEICVTCVHCRECLGYIKHEHLQRAYNNYDGLTSASVTSMRQNLPMNVNLL